MLKYTIVFSLNVNQKISAINSTFLLCILNNSHKYKPYLFINQKPSQKARRALTVDSSCLGTERDSYGGARRPVLHDLPSNSLRARNTLFYLPQENTHGKREDTALWRNGCDMLQGLFTETMEPILFFICSILVTGTSIIIIFTSILFVFF